MKPARLDWIVAVFVLLVQQNSFVWIPQSMADPADSTNSSDSPLNTACIVLSLILVVYRISPHLIKLFFLSLNNPFALLFTFITFLSTIWSIHPDLSIRRAFGYLLTMLIAAFICVRFKVDDGFKALSYSFAVSAIGSIVFIAAFPNYGIMTGGDLEGNWRGVFPHKNLLGFVMAVAVLTECYALVRRNGPIALRVLWLSVYFFVILMSKSTTALLVASFYFAVTIIYLIWMRNKAAGYAASATFLLLLVMTFLAMWTNPNLVLGEFGKDATLTGRTGVWVEVLRLIDQKPLLGWGYRAMWVPDDPTTIEVDERNGNWGVPSAHNAFLEVTLELGLLGLTVTLLMLADAFWRGLRCCIAGVLPLGLFSLIFIIGALSAGQTIETVGLNQEIDWLVFTILYFYCGASFSSLKVSARRKGFRQNALN